MGPATAKVRGGIRRNEERARDEQERAELHAQARRAPAEPADVDAGVPVYRRADRHEAVAEGHERKHECPACPDIHVRDDGVPASAWARGPHAGIADRCDGQDHRLRQGQ